MRRSVVVLGIAVVPMLLSSAGGAATGKPDTAGKTSPVSVVTLTGAPVTITTPGVLYEFDFSPASAVSFAQQPGEVVTVTMAASWDMPDPGALFCDLHTAVNLPNAATDGDTPIILRQNTLAQRGDDWWQLPDQSRDLTRTIPAPAAPTDHTLVGVTWMEDGSPGEEQEGDCYGTNYGFEYQEITATVRVSVVKMKG